VFFGVCSGYVVEKCEDGTDFWEKVPGVIPSSKNSHVVKDLEPGKKYKFRVKAENKFGPGQPVETNTAILAKNPFGNYTSYRCCQCRCHIKLMSYSLPIVIDTARDLVVVIDSHLTMASQVSTIRRATYFQLR